MEKIINYYRDNLTAYSLVFRYMKITYFFSLFIFGLFLISSYLMIIILPLLLFGIDWTKGIGIAYLTISIILTITISCLIKKAKVVIRNHYNIHVKKGGWRNVEFESMQTSMFVNYLKLNNLHSKEKMNLLVSFLEKNIEREKVPYFLAPGIFLGLFIPLWSQCVGFLLKGVRETDYNDFFGLMFVLVGVIIYFALAVGVYKIFLHLGKELFLFEHGLKKNLLLKIEDLLLMISDAECKDDEPSNLILRRKNNVLY